IQDVTSDRDRVASAPSPPPPPPPGRPRAAAGHHPHDQHEALHLSLLPTVPGVYPEARALPPGQLLPARDRLLRRLLDRCRHVRFHRLQLPRRPALLLQVFLVQPDRVPFAPGAEQLSGERLPRFALI